MKVIFVSPLVKIFWIIDAVGLSEIFFSTQNLAGAYHLLISKLFINLAKLIKNPKWFWDISNMTNLQAFKTKNSNLIVKNKHNVGLEIILFEF